MKANRIKEIYLKFFEKRGHKVIPSASLIPENDPTVLFTTAGMHPLVPFLLGEEHPAGRRLANVQKCVRTGDIDEVGDAAHLTFFEMLGNWSLGDYFKKETVRWSFDLLTSKEEGFGLDPRRLYVTVFEGDSDAPRDDESISLWHDQFDRHGIGAKTGERIFLYPKDENWWGPAGDTGPCGPDTEMFYDTVGGEDTSKHAEGWSAGGPVTDPERSRGELAEGGEGECHPNCECGRYVEIWNDVFMEYFRTAEGKYRPLEQKNVDTGMGFERMVMVLNDKKSVFDTELFVPLIKEIESLSGRKYGEDQRVTVAMRIISDHIRAATFILGDPRGVPPSNVDQGYVLRRLIRRAVRYGRMIGISDEFTTKLAGRVIEMYSGAYPELAENRKRIADELAAEESKFSRTLQRGLQEARKLLGEGGDKDEPIPGEKAFYLYESFGFPKELTEEVTGRQVNEAGWNAAMKRHQELSRKGAEQKFSGGLADHSEEVVRLHTATHLLLQSLRNILGEHVQQRGANINKDRIRFDFSYPQKLTPEQKQEVEDMVNEQIEKDLSVRYSTMGLEEAKSKGVTGVFEDKYAKFGNMVKVYEIGDGEKGCFSKEICGGPHVERTGGIGRFRIKKEEASSAGVRRIKAVLE